MNRVASWVSLASLLAFAGCALDRVEYTPLVKLRVPPCERAVIVPGGDTAEYERLAAQARLPHVSVREQYELECRAEDALGQPLGSQEYMLLGRIAGAGNRRSTPESLRASLCERAARAGGDVVLLVAEGVTEQPYAVTMPGAAHTRGYGRAQRFGNTVYARGQSLTTYDPSYTITGVRRLPQADGLVFRHVPGLAELRGATRRAGDAVLERVVTLLDAMRQDEHCTIDDFVARWKAILETREAEIALTVPAP